MRKTFCVNSVGLLMYRTSSETALSSSSVQTVQTQGRLCQRTSITLANVRTESGSNRWPDHVLGVQYEIIWGLIDQFHECSNMLGKLD